MSGWTLQGNLRGPQGTPAPTPTVVTLASDDTVSTTATNVTGMSAAVVAGTYRVTVLGIFVVSGGTSATYRLLLTGPAVSYVVLQTTYQTAVGTTLAAPGLVANTLSPAASAVQTNNAGLKYARLAGEITFTAAGTLQLQDQLGGTAPAGITKAGTRMIVEKMTP